MKKILIISTLAVLLVGCEKKADLVTFEATPTVELTQNTMTSEPELKIEILEEGKGDAAAKGDNLRMNYTGYLTDGTKFDSSLDRGVPFNFTLGGGQVIKGWDNGIEGMKVGEKRKLTIPYQMAYGERGIPGVIPAKATLIFDIELVEIVE